MNAPKKTEPVVGPLLASLVLLIPAALWWGFVSQKLWGWFVAPLGAPTISLWHAYGLSILVRLWTFVYRPPNDDETGWTGFVKAVFLAAFLPALCLATGALAHALS